MPKFQGKVEAVKIAERVAEVSLIDVFDPEEDGALSEPAPRFLLWTDIGAASSLPLTSQEMLRRSFWISLLNQALTSSLEIVLDTPSESDGRVTALSLVQQRQR